MIQKDKAVRWMAQRHGNPGKVKENHLYSLILIAMADILYCICAFHELFYQSFLSGTSISIELYMMVDHKMYTFINIPQPALFGC